MYKGKLNIYKERQGDKMGEKTDLAAVADVVNNLINKLATGVGWLASKETSQHIAVNTYIDEIKQSDCDPIVKAALISNAKKVIKEYCNQNDILKIAVSSMKGTAKPEEVEDDWLNQFMDKVKVVSDKDFQLIWGKILAEECNEPNSIPKALLHILEQMDKKDAIFFSTVCSVSVYVEEETKIYSPIIVESYMEKFYSKIGINYDSLVDLQALGLLEMNMGLGDNTYITTYEKNPIVIKYCGKEYEFPEGMNSFHMGNVIFTKAGQALCRAISVEERKEFWENYCIPIWEEDIHNYYNEREDELIREQKIHNYGESSIQRSLDESKTNKNHAKKKSLQLFYESKEVLVSEPQVNYDVNNPSKAVVICDDSYVQLQARDGKVQQYMVDVCLECIKLLKLINTYLQNSEVLCLRNIWFNTINPEMIISLDYMYQRENDMSYSVKEIKKMFHDGEMLDEWIWCGVHIRKIPVHMGSDHFDINNREFYEEVDNTKDLFFTWDDVKFKFQQDSKNKMYGKIRITNQGKFAISFKIQVEFEIQNEIKMELSKCVMCDDAKDLNGQDVFVLEGRESQIFDLVCEMDDNIIIIEEKPYNIEFKPVNQYPEYE